MNVSENLQNMTVEFCFPDYNSSCRKEVRANAGNVFLIIFFSCISVCTVFLNLLVLISISHFKQLHTPTNLLILSLAVADLLVGLTVMPVRIMELVDNCWYFGKLACSIFPVISSLSLSASICSLVFIAADRYIAIADPLLYSTKVTLAKMSLTIILGWSFCLVYVLMFLYFNNELLQSQVFQNCYGECPLFVNQTWGIIDLILFFLMPCTVILTLYSVIFNIARNQAKAVNAFTNGASRMPGAKASHSSETKAAKTLGIVVAVYLSCWIPFYLSSVSVQSVTSASVVWKVFGWIMCINSSVNPLIYAIFYPWFRVSVKYIVTCRIFESSSSRYNLSKRFKT